MKALTFFQLAGEGIVFFFVIRAIIACMLSLFAFDWIQAAGVANVSTGPISTSSFLPFLDVSLPLTDS